MHDKPKENKGQRGSVKGKSGVSEGPKARASEDAEGQGEANEPRTVDQHFKALFKKNTKFKLNKIQNAMYEDKNVREHMAQLRNGEDAIAFFAKYGNTTPIKFIHCLKNQEGLFNPYKLSIVHNANVLSKVDEYYTVSPSGIVLIFSSSQINRKDKFMAKTPTEFISLSDWMRESTLFNILSNIDFFKHYLTSKILRSWRENVKKALFKKTRERIRNNVFFCKPQFVNAVFEVKHSLTQVLSQDLVSFAHYQQKQFEFEEFKTMQKEVRLKAAKEFDNIFEEILAVLGRLVSAITACRDDNRHVEEDSAALTKHKPLNLIKKEKLEKLTRKELTETDFRLLSKFIRLVNYMAIETLVEVNKASFLKVEEELYRERKNGLFTTSPTLEDGNISLSHRQEDIVQAIESVFDENVRLVLEVPKVLGNSMFEGLVKDLLPADNPNMALIAPNIQRIIVESSSFKRTHARVLQKISQDFSECRKKIDSTYSQCKRINQEKNRFVADQWIESEPKLEEVKGKLAMMKEFKKESGEKIKDYFCGILHVDAKMMRNVLTTYITDSLSKIRDYLYGLMVAKVNETNKTMDALANMLGANFDSLQEYCDYIKSVKEVKESLDRVDASKAVIDQMAKLLKQVMDRFPNDVKTSLEQLAKTREHISDELPVAEDLIRSKKEDYVAKLAEQVEYVNDRSEELFVLLQCEELRKSSTPAIEANKRVVICKERLDKLEARHRKVKEHIGLMDTQVEDFRCDVGLLADIFERKRETWETFDLFFKKYEDWFEGNIKRINVETIEKEVRSFEVFCRDVRAKTAEQAGRVAKTFPHLVHQNPKGGERSSTVASVVVDDEDNNEILQVVAKKIDNMKELMPLLTALCNKHLKDKHWVQILELIEGGTNLLGKQFINFQELIGLNLKRHFDTIEDISARASGEFSIEQDLEKIKREWLDTNLTLIPYREFRDKFILGGVAELFEKLEDNLLKIQAMLSSKFAVEIRESLQVWERKLSLIHETLEEWLQFQQQWMYLENVFGAADIQKQLPTEYAKFFAMDKFWKETMLKVQKKAGVLDNVSGSELLGKFVESNKQMEVIQRLLEDYLELKRRLFPRFYFLSNDELLEIFSQTRNPEAIQPHLRKCFDNIKAIRFEDAEGDKETILGMVSAEPEDDKETVAFDQPVLAKGPIESWLKCIEEAMQQTLLSKVTSFAQRMESQEELLDFKALTEYPAQVVLVMNMLRWTSFAEFYLSEGDLSELVTSIKAQVLKSVELIKSPLSVGHRELVKNLIINDVHNRDVVEFLKTTNSTVSDFNWSKQFKYYFVSKEQLTGKEEGGDEQPVKKQGSKSSIGEAPQAESQPVGTAKTCFISQTNTLLPYGFEYLGNSPRLVITPLTDKCYLTLTSALHLTYGGAPAGPAGTGKTETTKDLAKAVAIVCIVFNCSDSLEFKTMGRFFSGLAQCGAWACFDEFNRIDVEVLSVIAQQIMVIQNAMRERKNEFDFEGKIIPLNPKFGVFITMNPGYAGRSELPDNLKALFRPVAMMIPDYALIAEIMLFSEGFQNAKEFGKKLVQLFKLSSEQLSKQRHYDFGMRAVKAVLNMAGAMRRKEPNSTEDDILLKSMRDSNLPKFLLPDIALFEGIIRDLFPNKSVQSQEYPDLVEHASQFLDGFNYQVGDSQLAKVKQLFEVSNIRHGVMAVGSASSGKTTTMDALVHGLGCLGTRPELFKLNPKAVTINELFGFNDLYTNTFTHGIVSKLVTQAMEDSSDSKKWIVFDGPVDAEWIENLNTVLDDNKMLCLPDGKRIKLPNSFSMIFEVEHLNAASPATVSRCGMVYFDRLTVDPVSAFHKFKKDVSATLSAKAEVEPKLRFIADLFAEQPFNETMAEVLSSALASFRAHPDQTIANTEYSTIGSGLKLFEVELEGLVEAVARRVRDIKVQSVLDKFVKGLETREMLLVLFGFSLAWSLGSNLTAVCKAEVGKAIKGCLMTKTGTFLMNFHSMFDFCFDRDRLTTVPWKSRVQDFAYSPAVSFSSILVETVESTTTKYFLTQLALRRVPVLINGGTGVGKTSIVKSFLSDLGEGLVCSTASFSAQTVSKNLENALCDKLSHRGKDLAPSAGKTLVFFIDDINMPKLDTYGSQPVNEMVRQILDQGGFYDMKKYVFRPVKNTIFLAACAPPEGGRNPMSQRLVRHFHTFSMADVADESFEMIFCSILKGYLVSQGDHEALAAAVPPLVRNSIRLYKLILTNLLPSPAKSHYTFNMRDLSKVFQGILLADLTEVDSEDKLTALWLHETTRVFGDRLVDSADRGWFYDRVLSTSQLTGKYTHEKLDALNFSSIVSPKYRIVAKPEDLEAAIVESFKNYALMNGKDLGLVVFPDMVRHVCRIKRILSFSKGNALLLGISGCGKRALANLAVFLNKNHMCRVEVTRSYKVQSWRDDLKAMMRLAAEETNLEGKKGVTFVMSDDQFVTESFLEDVNNMLNIGEIPNLFGKDEMDEVCGAMLSQLKDRKSAQPARTDPWEFFVSAVKENFHLVLTFSPMGSNFRAKCRQFPSLVNCCTIDYFSKWPAEALLTVAESQLRKSGIAVEKEVVSRVASVVTHMNEQAVYAATDFCDKTRRHTYVTPANFIDLLKSFASLLKEAQHSLPQKAKKYETGLQKLADTRSEIEGLQEKIIAFQPQLEVAREENKVLLRDLEEKSAVAREKEVVCEREAGEISQTRNSVSEMRVQCQAELNEALPALYAAQNAARNIDKGYIASIKSYNVVAKDIEMVLLALNLLMGRKESWDEVRKFLSDMDLIKKMQNLDPMTVPLKTWTRLRQVYLSKPEFNPAVLKEKVSEAISTIANYCINMEVYYFKKKEVDPKEQKLLGAETQLAEVEEAMKVKTRELEEVKAVVGGLQARLDSSVERERHLEEEQRRAKLHLERAEKLLVGLSEESVRWQQYAVGLREDEKNLVGDMLLASAYVSFAGPFSQQFRDQLLGQWVATVKDYDILVSPAFSLQGVLGEQVTIRDWQLKGLPADDFSVNNSLVVMHSVKFPLMIDPQTQMNKWLKNLYKDSGLMTVRVSNNMLLKLMENAIRFGNTVLVEDVGESLDSSLEPVLLKQTVKKGPTVFLKLNDQEVPFNPDFRLFLTTKLQNPHYLPETTIKVNVVNCMVTESGLENQLLVEIVLNECPKLEEQRDSLIRQISEDKKQLLEIQGRILRLINEVQGNLLDDEELLDSLDASKVTSEAINNRMKDAEVTNETIDKAREVYQSLAVQGAMLYFIVSALANLNLMYQFSLESFSAFFTLKMREDQEHLKDVQRRVDSLKHKLTLAVFKDVSKGLFSCHKLFFAFVVAVRTALASGSATQRLWAFFGNPGDYELASDELECPEGLKEKAWVGLCNLASISPAVAAVKKSIGSVQKEMAKLAKQNEVGLGDYQWWGNKTKGSSFEVMLLLKTIREDKVEQIAAGFVELVLGREYLDFPSISLKHSVAESTQDKPIVFILSPGADPLSQLIGLSQEMDMEVRFRIASLGQGQGDKANELIKTSRLNGEWVLLQNCHLAASWLSQLESLIENPNDESHADYKLFLTTMPSPSFPASILQKGIKLTIEPPKGIRANLRQTYTQMDPDSYDKTDSPTYKTLLFCLSMFHAIALERRKFGPIGWNIPYQWMNSDLETSQKHLLMHLEDAQAVPFETLTTLIGLINYGGRITDYNDERVVSALLAKFFNPNVFESGYSFAAAEDFSYCVPMTDRLESVQGYIDTLPLIDRPEIFGLNSNASINQDIQNAREFKVYLTLFEPGGQGAGGEEDGEGQVVRMIERMADKLSAPLKIDSRNAAQSMVIFRNQETERFNALIRKMKSSLAELRDAVKGLVVMSLELENMFACLLRQTVPDNWEKLSYLSLKPVGSWFDDFIRRVDFFRNWMLLGEMKSYWLSSFFFPQGFMTAVMQAFSRERGVAIDTLSFKANMTKSLFTSNELVSLNPSEGVNVHGLFLENAHFDIEKGAIDEAKPKELLEQLPIVWLQPVLASEVVQNEERVFDCPVYKTSERRGELSTTGHSTNFMTCFQLRTKKEGKDYWVRQGVAILLQTND